MNTLWTVFLANSSRRVRSGLTLVAAADALLSGDGRGWDVRPVDGGGFRIWTKFDAQPDLWLATPYLSAEVDRADAEDDIFRQVVADEIDGRAAMTDDAYDRMVRATEG